MVDVTTKEVSVRRASAQAIVAMAASTAAIARKGDSKKGDVLGVARLSAIQATKLTSQLIPLCHALPVESVDVSFDWSDDSTGDHDHDGPNHGLRPGGTVQEMGSSDAVPTLVPSAASPAGDSHGVKLTCRVSVKTTARTGVEMEALTGASVAALTVYDMLKSVQRNMRIESTVLLEKSGGTSGSYSAPK